MSDEKKVPAGFQEVCFNNLPDMSEETALTLPVEWPADKAAVQSVLIKAGIARGVPSADAATKIWAMIAPTKVMADVPVAPVNTGVTAAEMAQLLGTLGQSLADANRSFCPHCSKPLPKDFDGELCPKCAMPVRQTMKCVNCGTENDGVAEGDHCKKCGEVLVGSETRNMVSYLIRVRHYGSAGQAMSQINMLKTAGSAEWNALKAQTEAWVSGGGLADVATFLNATKPAGRHFNISATGEW